MHTRARLHATHVCTQHKTLTHTYTTNTGSKPFVVDESAHDESYEKVGLSFACVPIEDRSGNVLGVLEVGNKVYATTGLIQGFSEEDMKMIEAFSKMQEIHKNSRPCSYLFVSCFRPDIFDLYVETLTSLEFH
jgi:hypothetical protein